MANVAMQTAPCGSTAMHGVRSDDDGAELLAPNGKVAVLRNRRYVGYLIHEADNGKERNTREMVYFDVQMLRGAYEIIPQEKCPQPHKRDLNKQYHCLHEINVCESRTTKGKRCQLFTL